MDFSEALEAMKAGKKVRRSNWTEDKHFVFGTKEQYGSERFISEVEIEGHVYLESISPLNEDIFAKDWKIVEDIPKVKLKRSNDTYYIYPHCENHREIIVNLEDIENNADIQECYRCGGIVKILNLGEFYNESTKKNPLEKFQKWLEFMVQNSENHITNSLYNKRYSEVSDYATELNVYKQCLEKLNRMLE